MEAPFKNNTFYGGMLFEELCWRFVNKINFFLFSSGTLTCCQFH